MTLCLLLVVRMGTGRLLLTNPGAPAICSLAMAEYLPIREIIASPWGCGQFVNDIETIMIKVSNITKKFGERVVLDSISFNVNKGEIIGFLGPNGAGKTTTMRILTGFLPATDGSATVGSYDTFDDDMEVKKIIGYLPEQPPLYTDLTVLEYLQFVARLKGMSKKAIESGINITLDQCGLADVQKRLIANLSKGYRQRVGLAQALIHDPSVLILDEPTSGLDPVQIIEIRKLIQSLAGTRTIILSTHILPEATALCQRVIIINEGKIAAEDTPENLSAKLKQSEQISVTFKNYENVEQEISSIPGVLNVTIDPEKEGTFYIEAENSKDVEENIVQKAVAHEWGMSEIKKVSMSLEDVFLNIVTEENAE